MLSLTGLAPLASLSSDDTASNRPRSTGSTGCASPRIYALLGDLPDRKRPIGATKRQRGRARRLHPGNLGLDLNGIEKVPAYLARPRALAGRVPAVLFNHSHGGGYKIGKQEFIEGRSYLQPKPYAKELTELGYVALCIDSWIFGERSHTTEADMFKAMLWQGQVLWGMMVYDGLRALDYLSARPEVDPQRVATLGMSMGSTMAWWLGALDAADQGDRRHQLSD